MSLIFNFLFILPFLACIHSVFYCHLSGVELLFKFRTNEFDFFFSLRIIQVSLSFQQKLKFLKLYSEIKFELFSIFRMSV